MSDPVHRCAMGDKHCKGWTLGDDGKRAAAIITTPRGLCEACTAWVERTVRDLPRQWLKLELTLGEHRAPVSEKTRRPKPGSRIPINIASDELQHYIDDMLLEAAKAAANEMHMTLRMYPGHSTMQTYRRISHNANVAYSCSEKMLAHQDGITLAHNLTQLHKTIVRHLGETAQRERKHLPCPRCGAQGLVKEVQDNRGREYHSDGGTDTPEVVRCTNCDGVWTEAEYDWLSRMVLSEREEREMVEYLLAEARWQRDVQAWLAAERLWLLARAAVVTSMSVDEFIDALRQAAL